MELILYLTQQMVNIYSFQGIESDLSFFVLFLDRVGSVGIQCLWDDPRLHGESVPMYLLWDKRESSSPLISALLTDQVSIGKP